MLKDNEVLRGQVKDMQQHRTSSHADMDIQALLATKAREVTKLVEANTHLQSQVQSLITSNQPLRQEVRVGNGSLDIMC